MTCRRRNGMALVMALAATFALAGALAQAASARPLVSILSNTCLEPRSTVPIVEQFLGGKPVHTANCAADTNSGPQNWVTTSAGTATVRGRQGHFNVFRFFSGVGGCLTNAGRLGDGGAVVVGPCTTSTGTLWTLGRSGFNGSVELVNAHSGKCLDVQGGFLGAGIKMIQWTCSPGTPFEGNLFHIPPL